MWGILFLVSLAYAKTNFKVNTHNGFIEDEFGRVRIFHGMNAVVKLPPYLPTTDSFDARNSMSQKDIDYMTEWGFNFVRLGTIWEAVEKTAGVYDYEYLSKVNELITQLGEAGIYTLVDSHQDVLSRRLCGEGIPLDYAPVPTAKCEDTLVGKILRFTGFCKTIDEYVERVDENGLPLIEDCLKHMFPLYYTTPDANQLFENFYQNQTVRQAFINYWGQLAASVTDNPYVFGYDIINEPFAGSFYEHPEFYIPGVFDRKVLQPLYIDVAAKIRESDTQGIINFMPDQSPDVIGLFGGLVFDVGFTRTPGGEEYHDREIFNDHSYCCQAGNEVCAGAAQPSLENAKGFCRDFHRRRVQTRAKNARDLGVGLFFNEFGACSNSEACFEEIRGATDAFDDALASWAYWQYKYYDDITTTSNEAESLFNADGSVQKEFKLKALVRTYVQAFQGVPVSMKFDAYTGDFKTVFKVNASIQQPTEIYYNTEYYYPHGVDVSVTYGDKKATVTFPAQNRVHILFTEQLDDAVATVTLKPKAAPVQNEQGFLLATE